MKKGDILVCKKYTYRTIKSTGRVIEFNIGDKCEIHEYYGDGTMMLKKVGVNDYIGVIPNTYEYFETLHDYRKRIIEDLV